MIQRSGFYTGMRIQTTPDLVPTISRPAFGAQAASRAVEPDVVRFGAAASTYAKLSAELEKADQTGALVYEGNAMTDPELWSVDGTVAEVRRILADARQTWNAQGQAPGVGFVTTQYPIPELAELLMDTIQKLNGLMHPDNFLLKMASKAFRAASGIKGDMANLEAACDPARSGKVIVKIDLTGVTDSDLDKADKFMGNQQLIGMLKKLGVGNPSDAMIRKAKKAAGLE